MDYTISVIVPVYNAEKYMDKCIQSLIGQTVLPTEIILVDDGSKDKSGQKCDAYAEKHSCVKVIHKENGGLISAWKCGVENSTGDYVCFIDSDDWLDIHMFEEMSEKLTGNKKEVISSDYVIERTGGAQEYIYQTLAPGTYEKEQLREKVLPNLLGNERRFVTMSRCMKLISRSLILDNMHYSDESIRMAEDLTVMVPALLDCERLVVMDHKAYYHYLYVTESMVHYYDAGLYENNVKLRQILADTIKDKEAALGSEIVKSLLEQLEREYVHLLLLCIKNEARGNKEGYEKNILEICAKEKEEIKNYPVQVSEKANKLLYLVLRKPNWLTIHLLRLAMIVYYR